MSKFWSCYKTFWQDLVVVEEGAGKRIPCSCSPSSSPCLTSFDNTSYDLGCLKAWLKQEAQE